MKSSTIVLIVGAGALAYVVWRGQSTAPAANAGTVLAPAVGAPVAAAAPAAAVGSETAYATVKTDAGSIASTAAADLKALVNQLMPGVGGWGEPSGGV